MGPVFASVNLTPDGGLRTGSCEARIGEEKGRRYGGIFCPRRDTTSFATRKIQAIEGVDWDSTGGRVLSSSNLTRYDGRLGITSEAQKEMGRGGIDLILFGLLFFFARGVPRMG